MTDPIFVTRPSLPPLAELLPSLEEIWSTRILSNLGPFQQQFERRLCDLLGTPHLSLVANGMLALEAALSAADLDGEVITTPYSFVATTHAITRTGLTPVFADIRAEDFNIDPDQVEAAITSRTSAIVAVHCYGRPCDHDQLSQIADRNGLRLIYDAAHAFGVRKDGVELLSLGDFAIVSFHATKVFTTFEGGAVVSARPEDKSRVDLWRNFGIASETEIPAIGSNAKLNEFSAAVGLLQLDRFEGDRTARATVAQRYGDSLGEIAGIKLPASDHGVDANFSYYPIRVGPEYAASRDQLYDELRAQQIFARRYFFPLLSELPMYADLPSAGHKNLPIASRAASDVLCLPIYPDLSAADQDRIIAVVREVGRQ